jgi:hypothetical protein
LALLILGMMDPSTVWGKLDSLLEASSIWVTEGAHIDAYFINESWEEVKCRVDICAHIGCESNDLTLTRAHQNDFLSCQKAPGGMKNCIFPWSSIPVVLKEEECERVHYKLV